jgi:biotin transport system permease protein
MSLLGMYRPGGSLVHRLPAGLKLGVLVVVGALSFMLDTATTVGMAFAVAVAIHLLARLPVSMVIRQVWALTPVLLGITLFHVLATGWSRAVVVAGSLMILVLLAGVVTATTRMSALVDVIVALAGPLRRLGIDPERIGLLFALGVRSVFVILGFATEVRDAQHSRGLAASPRAFAVPLILRSIRHAEQVGEALVARGLGD